ncbi:zinc finger, CCHC-type containing protein, partial [Tanacetum coccineum]
PKDIIPNSDESQRDDHSDDVPSEIPEPRKGKRVCKAKSYGSDFQLYLVEGSRDQVGSQYSYCYSIEEDPRTYNEAMQSRDSAFLKEAIDDVIGCKWIFKRKMKVDGTIDKFKARLVIQGFRQKEGIDNFDTYAPVARITTIRLLLALAAIHNLVIHQMDVKTSFLNGDLDEEVYMKQLEGFVMPGNEHKVCKLVKSLYDLKQAPKQWHQKFDKVVLSSGFLLNQSDKCIYNKFDSSGKYVIIYLYVDDMLIFGTDQNQVDKTKKFLSSKFSMKDMGEADVILGIKIKRENKRIVITQSHYIEKVLKKFNREDCSMMCTPMDPIEKLMPNTGKPVDQLEYSRAIGCLMYAMMSTRPDIAYSVGRLSRFTSNPIRRNALAATGKEAEWLRNLIHEIPVWPKPIAPISIHCDSARLKGPPIKYGGQGGHAPLRGQGAEPLAGVSLPGQRAGDEGAAPFASSVLSFGSEKNPTLVKYYVSLISEAFYVQTYESVEDGSVLYMGDDHFGPVHGKGSVVLEFSSGKSITLFNVLYVPKLRFGYYNNGMFMLNLNKVPDDSGSVYMSSSTVVNSSLWHARLGHVHYKRMLEMSKDDLIPAIDENTEKCRITHETTTPYTPQQNCVTERKNRALKEMVNFMLSYSGLSDGFWGEAMLTACYLLNRVPNKRNKTTPYELWYKKRPNQTFLRVWGCRAVVRLPDPKRKTLGEKGIDYIFVGYAEHSKAYRFYVIEPNDSVSINSIIESRDAIFDENRFSSIPRPKDIIPNSDESQRDDHSDDVPSEIPEPRKGKRVRKAKSYGSDFQLYLVEGSRDQVGSQYSYCYSIEEDPRTYNEAMQSRDSAFWKEAIDDEIGSIMENNTWVLSDLPPGCKPLGCKWIFKRKMKVDGTIDKFKARLVIQGFRQKEGIDYFDTYAPVALGRLSRFTSNPSRQHWHAITRVFKYLKALTATGKEAEWLRNLIYEISIWQKSIAPISIHCDSAATLAKAYSQNVQVLDEAKLSNVDDLWKDFSFADSARQVDTMIIEAIGLLDDLDKELSTYAMRVREWYGWHFLELAKIVQDNIHYAKAVKLMGYHTNAAKLDFSEVSIYTLFFYHTMILRTLDLWLESESVRTLRTRIGRRESWWISDEVQDKVKAKQTRFRELISMRGEDEANRSAAEERYKEAKREAKKAVARAKEKAYEDLYKRLDSKEGVNDIYRIAKARDRRKRDIGNVRFIKDGGGRSIVNEDAIRRRWKEYFSDLFNGQKSVRTEEADSIGANPQNNCYCSRIRYIEVKEALRKMGRNKAVGPDEIPIEAWRCLGGEGVRWVTTLFNKGVLKCPTSGDSARNVSDRNEEEEIRIGDHILEAKESFRYLGSVMHKSGRIEDDVSHRIQVGWLKWRGATGILCDKKVPLKLKGKFYRVAIRPAMMYGSECWPLTKAQANRMEVAEMRMLRWTCEDHNPVRRVESLTVDGARRRGRPKLRWEDRLKTDLKEMLLSEDMTSDRNAWSTRIRLFLLPRVMLRPSPLYVPSVLLLCARCAFPPCAFVVLGASFRCFCFVLGPVFLEGVPLPSGRGVTVYIPPPPYLAPAGLGYVVVVVVIVESINRHLVKKDDKFCEIGQNAGLHDQQILVEEVEAVLKEAAVVSMRTEVSDLDLINIKDLCDQVLSLSEYRAQLYDYLKSRMNSIAPNLTALIGELMGARLIAHGAAPKHKGKVSRSLASKTALAIRCDALGENQDNSMGVENRLKLEARLRNLKGQELGRSAGSTKGKLKIEFYKDQKTGGGAMITPANQRLRKRRKGKKKTEFVHEEGKVSEDVAADEDVGKKEKKKKKKHVADEAAETQNEETVKAEQKKKKRKHAEADEAETETPTTEDTSSIELLPNEILQLSLNSSAAADEFLQSRVSLVEE